MAEQFGPIREALRQGCAIRWADDTVRHMLEALDAAEARADRLAMWEKLGDYLHHWPSCDSMALGPDGKLPADCSCGLRLKLSAALAAGETKA